MFFIRDLTGYICQVPLVNGCVRTSYCRDVVLDTLQGKFYEEYGHVIAVLNVDICDDMGKLVEVLRYMRCS